MGKSPAEGKSDRADDKDFWRALGLIAVTLFVVALAVGWALGS